jgi:hypothetical protein
MARETTKTSRTVRLDTDEAQMLKRTGESLIKAEIDPPRAGWSMLRISRGEQAVEFPFSYTPDDSIGLLAEAVDAIVTDPVKRTVVFHNGANRHELVFERTEDRVDIRVRSWSGGVESPSEERLSLVLNSRLTGKLFWRALRQLESRCEGQIHEREWRRPFPTRLVAQLGARLEE